MTQVGEAFVRVRPLATGFGPELERQTGPPLRRLERNLNQTNREFSRFGRGALVGTGALGGLGRAAAFASTSFIGGAGLVYGIKSSIAAAEESQVAATQLANALQHEGISLKQNQAAIEARTQALSQMSGFDDELISKTFTNFVRRTGDVTKALELNATAVDVARGRNISLESASALVTRASLGMAGALRRVGIAAKEGATATELLELLQRKYAGSAEAYGETAAGAQERFSVAIENTQEIIGRALLPSLTRLLTKGADWLNNSENQEKIQKRVNDTAETGGKVAHGLARAYDITAEAVGQGKDALDGFVATLNKIPGGDLGTRLESKGLVEDMHDVSVYLDGTVLGDNWDPTSKVKEMLNALQGGLPSGGAFGIPFVDKAFATPEPEKPPLFQFGGLPDNNPLARDATRDEKTATDLARAQAEGTQKQIIAAANARLAFINDTIAFAKKLEAEGRGDTKALEATLQKFYSEQGSTQGIIDQIVQKNASDAEKAAQDAKTKAAQAQSAYEETIRTRITRLRTAVAATKLGTETRKKADDALNAALRAEAKDTRLSASQRAQYASDVVNELSREESDRKDLAERLKNFILPGKIPGLLTPGNLDLFQRKIAVLNDNTIGTVRSASISVEGKGEVLIPTIAGGKPLTLKQAIDRYFRTGQNLGVFATVADAEAYAERLHQQQARFYKAAGDVLLKARKDAADARQQLVDQIRLQTITNAVSRAQLIKDPKSELDAERKADRVIVEYYRQRANNKKLTLLERKQAEGDYLTALKNLGDLDKKTNQAAQGYSLQQLFSYAEDQFKQYGSNIGDVLSTQDARGEYGGIVGRGRDDTKAAAVKTHQTVVFQNFFGDRNTAQAMNDARSSARNLK